MGRTAKIGFAGVGLLALALAGLWSARRTIAENAIERELERRGARATYVVREIGVRTQRLENIVIGDPARPDLTVRWAEVDLVPSWSGVAVRGIRAGGVVLRGRYDGTTLSWGAVDKLLLPPSGGPLSLPDIDATLRNARVLVATPYGPVGLFVEGSGQLDDGFRGRGVLASSSLVTGGCSIRAVRAFATLETAGGKLAAGGPVSAAGAACGGAVLSDLAGELATGDLLAPRLVSGKLRAERARYADTAVRGAMLDGEAKLRGDMLTFAGRVSGQHIEAGRAAFDAITRGLAGADRGPLQGIARQLAVATRGLQQGVAGRSQLNVERRGERTSWALTDLTLTAASGARITGTVASPPRAVADLRLSGGGFPETVARLSGRGDGWAGTVTLAPMAAGGSRLLLSPVALELERNGRVGAVTRATLDGPLGDGRVEGLTLPLSLSRDSRGAIAALPGCTPVAWRSLTIAGARFDPLSTRLCPSNGGALVKWREGQMSGGATTGPLRLTGRSGGSPFSLAAASARYGLDGSLRVERVAARLDTGSEQTRLDIARVDGRAGLTGSFAGLSGQIGEVPLLASAGQGQWRVAGRALDVTGIMQVADAATEARFVPLIADGARLRLEDGRVTATATLREPTTRRAVTGVDIVHDLSRGVGEARLRVAGLSFGKVLQPDMITPLTTGVVQLVQGIVDGTGTIRWTRDRVTSSGRFSTDSLDFAAAFGPVTGARGTVEFDDLLAMSTPPGQRITLATVNPGVEVEGGVIEYRLRPNQVVEIERGRWPFAGGELLLEPATLDFGNEGSRRLVFRVVGLDAGKFIERLQLQDIAATGVFDGALPVVFGANEGRVEGGRIVARGGGTLSYVGDVSNAQTNTLTRLAFDALKSIRYQNLAIELDGALDGEIVSRVLFTGTNQAPVAPTGLVRSFTGLPFKFNIVVRAPFRGLVNTARSLQDPAILVQPTDSATGPDTKRR